MTGFWYSTAKENIKHVLQHSRLLSISPEGPHHYYWATSERSKAFLRRLSIIGESGMRVRKSQYDSGLGGHWITVHPVYLERAAYWLERIEEAPKDHGCIRLD